MNPSHPIHFKLIVVLWCLYLSVEVTNRQSNVWSKLFEIFTYTSICKSSYWDGKQGRTQ